MSQKSSALLFAKFGRCILKPRPVQLFGEPIQWVSTGVTLIHGSPSQLISIRLERKQHKDCRCLDLSKQEKWCLHQQRSSAVQGAHPTFDGLCVRHLEGHHLHPYQGIAGASVQVSLYCYQYTSKFTMILVVPLFTNHISSLTERFNSKLADVGNPLVTQLGRYLR
jgi:hypothetical protein